MTDDVLRMWAWARHIAALVTLTIYSAVVGYLGYLYDKIDNRPLYWFMLGMAVVIAYWISMVHYGCTREDC